jgi:CysZ protein
MSAPTPRGPLAGAGYFVRGLRLLGHPRLRGVVALPLAINTLLFAAAIAYVASDFHAWVDRLVPTWLEWLRWLLWPLFAIAVLLALFYGFTLVANVVGAPFNAILAARVEALLRGDSAQPAAVGSGAALREALRGLGSELRKLGYFAVRAAPLLVLFLIPGVNAAAPFLWFTFSAWMLTLEYLDYPMGNHGIGFREQRRRLRTRPGLAFGFGGATLVATLLPGLNFIAMPAAVAGAAVMWVEALAPVPPP